MQVAAQASLGCDGFCFEEGCFVSEPVLSFEATLPE